MDILLLCGYFEPKYQEEISRKTKTWVENAANTFQQRLIAGLRAQDVNLEVVSAPFIGPWPTAYEDMLFKSFEAGESAENVQYIPFNNIWGYRNISRTAALKKRVRDFARKSEAEKKAIIVYCPHTPFLEAAAVSYTHLDVYKRQAAQAGDGHRAVAAGDHRAQSVHGARGAGDLELRPRAGAV